MNEVANAVNRKDEEPGEETLPYMGMDSTAFIDIAFVKIDEPDESIKTVNDWLNKKIKPGKAQKSTRTKMFQTGIDLAKNLVAESNKIINVAAKNFADNAIIIGTICLKLKELNRSSGIPWEVKAEESMPFLNKRNRQKFMLLAKRKDCHAFSYLGVDRMETLCSLTKTSEEDSPIGALLDKYSIPYDEKSELNMEEFKKSVDAAVSTERLLKNGFDFSFDRVKDVTNAGVKIDKSVIKRLKEIQKCEGNPETLIKDLATNQGADDPEETSEKRLQDFNTLSERLIKSMDYIIKNVDLLDNLDSDTFVNLLNKLLELKNAAKIDIETEAEEEEEA